jgi:two-component system response regulator YesN
VIRILIADPDKENRKNFKTYIHSFQLGLRVIKEVETGVQILEELDKGEIHLIIADMRLPGLTGYQVFEKMKERHPTVKMILYGSIDEHKYMERALEEGLVAYLFKPVKTQELNRCLMQAKQLFEDLQKQEEEENWLLTLYEQKLPVFQDRFLINLVHGHMEKDSEIERGFQYFHMPLSSAYTVLVIKVDFFDKITLAVEEKDKHLLIFSVFYKIDRMLASIENGIAFINRLDEITIVLGNSWSLEQSLEFAAQVHDKIEKEKQVTVTIGIGTTVQNPRDICISYKQAKAALRHNFYLGNASTIPICYVEPDNHITYQYPLKKEELLVYEVVIGNPVKALKLLDEIFVVLRSCDPLPDKLVPKIILDIFVSINRYASEQKIQLDDFFAKYISIKELMQKDGLDDTYVYVKDLLSKICGYIQSLREDKSDWIYQCAKNYVEAFYFENISLVKTAFIVNSTPEYVNKIFQKKENKSFYEYYVKVRINKAKELMVETQLDDFEIAQKVGYQDAKYFNGIFFQTEGISTTDYRIQKGKSDGFRRA